jgi:hypothetical protein
MSKGSARRPGTMPPDAWERIFKPLHAPLFCGACNDEQCVCQPTTDGPGQDEASQEVKTHYERRRFDREGV